MAVKGRKNQIRDLKDTWVSVFILIEKRIPHKPLKED